MESNENLTTYLNVLSVVDGFTRDIVAKEIGINRISLYYWLNNEPRLDRQTRIVNAIVSLKLKKMLSKVGAFIGS